MAGETLGQSGDTIIGGIDDVTRQEHSEEAEKTLGKELDTVLGLDRSTAPNKFESESISKLGGELDEILDLKENQSAEKGEKEGITRREFVQLGAAAGGILALGMIARKLGVEFNGEYSPNVIEKIDETVSNLREGLMDRMDKNGVAPDKQLEILGKFDSFSKTEKVGATDDYKNFHEGIHGFTKELEESLEKKGEKEEKFSDPLAPRPMRDESDPTNL